MEIRQSAIRRVFMWAVAALLGEGLPTGEGYSDAHSRRQLARFKKLFTTFPLTGEGSVPTFYAFSGVETAGEHEAQDKLFSRARFDWLETCSAVNF